MTATSTGPTLEAPKHSRAFLARRVANWFPLGLAYALFYMGRYNLTVAKAALGEDMTNAEFGNIFAVGAITYGVSFLISGPITDRLGGRVTMLFGTAGTMVVNMLMGLVLYGIENLGWDLPIVGTFTLLYALNMHFQSYGAIAIVTTKAPWFHVRERGRFSTIFGWMISSGVFLAFDQGYAIVEATRATPAADLSGTAAVWHGWVGFWNDLLGLQHAGMDQNWWLFMTPAMLLAVVWVVMFFYLRNSPGEAGYDDFDTGEEQVTKEGEKVPVYEVFKRILKHDVLFFVIIIELCSGVLRNGIMHWYMIYAKQVGFRADFYVSANWGWCLLWAGIVGAFLTGWASDKFHGSRRAPMAGYLYAVMFGGLMIMTLTMDSNLWWGGSMVILISMAVIGVHGILSGTATADFAGVRNAGVATGIVDGFVYLGAGIQSFVIGQIAPVGEAAKDPNNWVYWPMFLVPWALAGFLVTLKIWNAVPGGKR